MRYRKTDHGRAVVAAVNLRFRQKPLNAEKDRLHSRRHREARYGIQSELPMGYEALVLEVFDHRCAACGCSAQVKELVLDHHRPLREGNALLHNAVPLCRSCNAKKNRTAPEQFYEPSRLAEITRLLVLVRTEFETRFEKRGTAC